MADSSEISALYPPPPPYYKLFTHTNVKKFNELRKEGLNDEQLEEIPDIKFLVRPKLPTKEQYRSFGDLWWFEDKQVSLKENNLTKAYIEEEEEEEVFTKARIDELKKMTKSLLLNFLELVGLLSSNPKLAAKKIDNIRTILINIHHLLNSYRLHQSRETLILSMQKKLSETQDEIHGIRTTCSQVEVKLNTLVERLQQLQNAGGKETEINHEYDLGKKMYNVPKELRNEATEFLLKQQKR
ncbi:hypothetical protein PICMEDRAFT_29893 [Pichia membranifaciens NRRL Y-2026]|uniref:Mediator of RNA polymerase II transcription subunit 7 n=1 Tax=Pichia membranifaciens NRRL Y-2026 TaxID=763406 RepID=A0A1E3NTB1_9ASCO|nr:hypothetical protein PICMEDRAFT_29893 [Pichia membranifaciens NRRL Y-2026]ODQ49300.1 hypothetical protein PICMEDRAFT_29893 [Pichia membranifaciens NRRL Y-2026]